MLFLGKQPTDEYRPSMRLSGTTGPINTLAFTHNAKFLASGGDDEKVRIWDVARKQIHQVIGDDLERWGQVTCARWLPVSLEHGYTLCFGTGRGLILIYQQTEEADTFKEVSSFSAFPFNEPVEAMDYNLSRLVVSSHTGKIKLFHIEKNGTFLTLWSKNWNERQDTKGVIPRSVQFMEKGESIIIFGLESGLMVSKAAANGLDNWSKHLKSSIGNVSFSTSRQWILVDNLSKGFDLYSYPRSSPLTSFSVARTKAFVQQGVFLEDGASVACGSGHGYIHIFSCRRSTCLQKLRHGSTKTTVQVLDACSTKNQHLIASGTNDKEPVIIIWEKKIKGRPGQQRTYRCNSITTVAFFLSMMLFAVAWKLGNGSQNWLNTQYNIVRQVVGVPMCYRSVREVDDNAKGL